MDLILRLGLVSCALYLIAVLLVEAAIRGLSRWRLISGVDATRLGWTFLFGLLWLAAFQLAWLLVVPALIRRVKS